MAVNLTVDTYKAMYDGSKFGGNCTPEMTHPDSDTGVFVNTGDGRKGEFFPPRRGRTTSANGYSRGILNMIGTTVSEALACSIAIGSGTNGLNAGLMVCKPSSSHLIDSPTDVYKNLSVPKSGHVEVTKLEVLTKGRYAVTSGGSEAYYHIYAMGFTTMAYDESGGCTGHVSWMFAPMVDFDNADGYPNINTTEYPYITNSSVMFDDNGDVASTLVPGTNVAHAANSISLAMSDSVLEANDGMLAVACMVSGDGYARWVGYKNGIYKVYQGSKPLYGMPGERMTIKGHEFVCLAYGPFYARLS